MRLSLDGTTLQITYRHPHPEAASALLMADVGTSDPAFLDGLTGQIASIGAYGRRVDETASNFLMAVVRAVQPRDELEAMLAVQMAAIHSATLMMARRLNHVETLPQQEDAERALNKLARTYAGQMEALKRYRSKGTQVVRVERVTVESGGQAVVGHVETGTQDRGEGQP